MRQYKLVNTILLSNINTELKTTKFKTREKLETLHFSSFRLGPVRRFLHFYLNHSTLKTSKCETQRLLLIHKTKLSNII